MKQIKDYELACNALVEVFCRKQEMEFDGWVNGDIGGIVTGKQIGRAHV